MSMSSMIYNNNDFTKQANAIIGGFSDSIIKAFEKYNYGDCDEMGPTEHFWSLYIIIKKADGSIENLKYYREVYEMQGDKDSEINYLSEKITESDYTMFNKMLANQNDNQNDYNHSDY